METKQITFTKAEAMDMVRADIQHSGKPLSRRQYAAIWNVPPSTAYYWIKEAKEKAVASL